MTLGLVVNPSDTHHVSTAALYLVSLAEQARSKGYLLTIFAGDDGVREIQSAYASKVVDGFLIMEVCEDDARLALVRSEGIPAVSIGMPSDTRDLDAVDFDFSGAGRLAVERLHALGATRVAFVCWPAALYRLRATYAVRTRKAVESLAAELGIALDTFECASEPREMRRLLQSLLDDDSYNGLVFHNDAAAPILGELLARSPRPSLPVTGLCPARVADEHWLPFETIDTRALGSTSAAVDLLVERLQKGGKPGTRLLLEPLLIAPHPSGR
jgi:DNA-binding LacI/PurR family transcriptional regulator